MIIKLKLDNKPNIGDGLTHDEFSPIIVCIENKDFPICEFKFQHKPRVINAALFNSGMSYRKLCNVLIEDSVEFKEESVKEYTIQK